MIVCPPRKIGSICYKPKNLAHPHPFRLQVNCNFFASHSLMPHLLQENPSLVVFR
jgi:hypothetical protein